MAEREQQRAARRLLAVVERQIVADPAGEVDPQRRTGDCHQARGVGDAVADDDRPVSAVHGDRIGECQSEFGEPFRNTHPKRVASIVVAANPVGGSGEVRVGVALADMSEFVAIDPAYGIGDQRAQFEALLAAELDARGAPHGVTIVPVFRTFSSTSIDHKRAVADEFAADDVLCVLGARDFTYGAVRLAETHAVPVIDVNAIPRTLFARTDPWLFTIRSGTGSRLSHVRRLGPPIGSARRPSNRRVLGSLHGDERGDRDRSPHRTRPRAARPRPVRRRRRRERSRRRGCRALPGGRRRRGRAVRQREQHGAHAARRRCGRLPTSRRRPRDWRARHRCLRQRDAGRDLRGDTGTGDEPDR